MTAPRGIAEKIHDLKQNGLSYSAICKELGCSKGTVSYHLGKGVKEKQRERNKNNFSSSVSKKLSRFKLREHKDFVEDIKRNTKIRICNKIKNFKSEGSMSSDITYDDLMNKIGDDPKCYLTGDKINLEDTRSWHLDHIVPVSKGGDNSIENCNIATKEANMAKSDMSIDDFTALCQKVLIAQGYQVSPC